MRGGACKKYVMGRMKVSKRASGHSIPEPRERRAAVLSGAPVMPPQEADSTGSPFPFTATTSCGQRPEARAATSFRSPPDPAADGRRRLSPGPQDPPALSLGAMLRWVRGFVLPTSINKEDREANRRFGNVFSPLDCYETETEKVDITQLQECLLSTVPSSVVEVGGSGGGREGRRWGQQRRWAQPKKLPWNSSPHTAYSLLQDASLQGCNRDERGELLTGCPGIFLMDL
ncbi:uncharacterized protein [Notamacropus eugenii]|uniref:uncharacterized protein n=1 Tax=Notamacropus eugenii TaxID=9315 RepID=UPI003B67B674